MYARNLITSKVQTRAEVKEAKGEEESEEKHGDDGSEEQRVFMVRPQFYLYNTASHTQ